MNSNETGNNNPTNYIPLLTVALVICVLGWYFSSTSGESCDNSDYSAVENDDESLDALSRYKEALEKANETIEESNSCVDNAFSSFDDGYFEDGMSELDGCRYDTVDESDYI